MYDAEQYKRRQQKCLEKQNRWYDRNKQQIGQREAIKRFNKRITGTWSQQLWNRYLLFGTLDNWDIIESTWSAETFS